MPYKKECNKCNRKLIPVIYTANTDFSQYPCLLEECPYELVDTENSIISVTKHYFNTDMLHAGDVVYIQEVKHDTGFPAILFSVDKDKILAMRDTGENKTTQVILRPEDVAGNIYKITQIDWQQCLRR